ncbi:hypothetical protein KY359_02340 [Candidatus Woesearchaeota archaeon]|nr:hypothetical protein [Candidatus Woesearchaeota archaeon]
MRRQEIKCGETACGKGPFTIDDVTTGAVILLRQKGAEQIAVMHLDAMDAPRAYQLVQELLKTYLETAGVAVQVPADSIEAVVIGGDYREHRITDRSVVVYVDHVLAKEKAEEALQLCGIRFTYMDTDRLDTKRVDIRNAEDLRISGEPLGNNKLPAQTSEIDYDMTFRFDDAD